MPRLSAIRLATTENPGEGASTRICSILIMQIRSLAQPVELFTADRGYPNFRIPSLLSTLDGTLIAIVEGRTRDDPGDGGLIDLVARRSVDGGVHWSPMGVIEHFPSGSVSNPTPVLDTHTGRAWLFFNRWEGTASERESRPGTRDNTAWARYSDDAGITWSEPIDLTAHVKDNVTWNSMTFGPGSGIQTRSGRLIVPAYRWQNGPNSFAIFSDDHGVTWHRGELAPGGNLSNECQVVELANGTILLDARAADDAASNRLLAVSSDRGQTWSHPKTGLAAPAIKGSIARLIIGGDDCVIWIGPRGPGRANLTLRISRDSAQTFSEEHPLHTGYAGYSDIRIMPDGTLAILWEIAEGRSIVFSRFRIDWA